MLLLLHAIFLPVVISAAESTAVIKTKENVDGPLVGWKAVGCYTDSSTSRTLLGASTNTLTMTIAACNAYCSAGAYSYSGLEYGQECYCGYTIQETATTVDASECNYPCAGDSGSLCGGQNRVFIYYNGTPPPQNNPVVGDWTYKGCFTDNRVTRSLHKKVDIQGGVTVEKCASECKASNYGISGTEYGIECWCGEFLEGGTKTQDGDCGMTCEADSTEFCGAADRLTIYQDTQAAQVDSHHCLQTTRSNFTLVAIGKQLGSKAIPVKVIDVNTVPLVGYSILSACTTCFSLWTSINLEDRGLYPVSATNPNLKSTSWSLPEGGSPTFISTQLPPPAYGGYCTTENPLNTDGPLLGPLILAGNHNPDQWALCPNITANGRLDVVWSPTVNNPHYDRRSCQDVYLQLV